MDGCKQRANSAGDFGPVGILDSARQLNVCPHRTFNLLRPWANLHLDLLTFTATAEPKVSVQLLQQPLAERVSHRVQSFCPQQSESVSSAQTLGAEISPRSRLVDKHAVNNPSAHISTFFLYCLLSQHIESESEPPAMVTNYIAFQPRTSSLNPLIDGFNRWQSPQYVVDTSVTVPYKSLCFHHIK